MATFVSCHARSVSLPSGPHLTGTQFDNLTRLRSSASASTSVSSITNKLNSLKDLYVCVDDLLLLPSNMHALSKLEGKVIDEIMEATLPLGCLWRNNSCFGAQDIQSVLRRRCSGDLSAAKEAVAYLKCRKEAKKVMNTLLKDARNVQKKCTTYLEKNNGNSKVANTLMEMQLATVEILTTLLSYVAGSTKTRLSMVSKFILQVEKKEVKSSSKFDEVDDAVQSMINLKEVEHYTS